MIILYYTLRFYFPYLSLLAQPVTIFVYIDFPYCMLLFDKSNKPPIKLETVVTWSKSNLNMMNIYEESTINFWICGEIFFPISKWVHTLCNLYSRTLKVIVYFRKVFLLSKFEYFCFVMILDMSLISQSCKNEPRV
jgi:hypothetical protein